MLGHKFPGAQFVVIGVLGPGSNPHGSFSFLELRFMFSIGPNEFLHIPLMKNLTAMVAALLVEQNHHK